MFRTSVYKNSDSLGNLKIPQIGIKKSQNTFVGDRSRTRKDEARVWHKHPTKKFIIGEPKKELKKPRVSFGIS
jgi:hypothetical protein